MVMGGASPKRGGWGEAIPSPLTQLLCPTHRQHHGGAGGSGGPVGAGEAGAARGTLLGAGWGVCVCANGIREGGPMPPWRFSEGHPPPSPYSPSHRALLGLLGVPASLVVPTCPGGGGGDRPETWGDGGTGGRGGSQQGATTPPHSITQWGGGVSYRRSLGTRGSLHQHALWEEKGGGLGRQRVALGWCHRPGWGGTPQTGGDTGQGHTRTGSRTAGSPFSPL